MTSKFDRFVIRFWRFLAIAGDPPRIVQRSFDRENARILREEL